MERLWVGVICNCMYGNEKENRVIDNVEENLYKFIFFDITPTNLLCVLGARFT